MPPLCAVSPSGQGPGCARPAFQTCLWRAGSGPQGGGSVAPDPELGGNKGTCWGRGDPSRKPWAALWSPAPPAPGSCGGKYRAARGPGPAMPPLLACNLVTGARTRAQGPLRNTALLVQSHRSRAGPGASASPLSEGFPNAGRGPPKAGFYPRLDRGLLSALDTGRLWVGPWRVYWLIKEDAFLRTTRCATCARSLVCVTWNVGCFPAKMPLHPHFRHLLRAWGRHTAGCSRPWGW